ncbi:MAG: MetS family NSS transporter small subunit [Cyclobacteriaceae bacterium]
MNAISVISMVINLSLVFGGFLYFLLLAIKKEKANSEK